MKLKPYKFTDLIKDFFQSAKNVKYRIIYITFAIIALIGVGILALSLYSRIVFLAPLLFAGFCFLISPVMEVYASSHLETEVHYSLTHGCIASSYGYFHLVFSWIKGLVFGNLLGIGVWAITLGFCSISNPGIADEIVNILSQIVQNTNNGGLEIYMSELAYFLIVLLNSLTVCFAFIGFFASIRKNELANAFTSAYLNENKAFFLFNPLRKQIFNQIYNRFRVDYRLKTWWTTAIGLILIAGSFVGGVFLGLEIQKNLDTIDPYYFAAGLSTIAFAIWYGVERIVDNLYIRHQREELNELVPQFIATQMASVKMIYQRGFPHGRFDSHAFPDVDIQGNIRGGASFNEETLKKFFFLYYSDKIINTVPYVEEPVTVDFNEAPIQSVEFTSEEEKTVPEEKKDDKSSQVVGLFGFDDFTDDKKEGDK